MYRAKMWASVMNSRVVDSGFTTSEIDFWALRLSSTKFECVMMQPLGLPVVPEV